MGWGIGPCQIPAALQAFFTFFSWNPVWSTVTTQMWKPVTGAKGWTCVITNPSLQKQLPTACRQLQKPLVLRLQLCMSQPHQG